MDTWSLTDRFTLLMHGTISPIFVAENPQHASMIESQDITKKASRRRAKNAPMIMGMIPIRIQKPDTVSVSGHS